MGGEPLVTPPGFHFFVSVLTLLTGMPVILAQLITATFFSSAIVFPVYLVSKKILKKPNAGLLSAFFASISALSVEMLCWGGYANIVSLFLIATIFYLFFRDVENPALFHLVLGTLFFGAIVLTHTFSLAAFVPVLALYLVLLFVGKLGKLKEMQLLSVLRFFVVSSVLGMMLVLPWILRVFNFYFTASSEGVLAGGADYKSLILANCKINPILLTIIVILVPALIVFKDSRKRYIDRSSLLLISWFLVPVIMTQAYVFGVYTHYSRFVYFIDFPIIIMLSAVLLYIYHKSTHAINRFVNIRWVRTKKVLSTVGLTLIVFGVVIFSSWSMFPKDGMNEVTTYSTIQQSEATVIDWIKNNTPEGSVLVADHLYGWWLSGISKRPTLSAADLVFLLYSYEWDVAENAHLLLDTNYYLENGLIQVRDSGPYMSRRSPEVGIKLLNGDSFALFQFNEIQLKCSQETVDLSDLTLTENTIAECENSVVLFTMTYENELFVVKKTLQLRQGLRFAELSYDVETKAIQTDGFEVSFPIFTGATYNLTVDDVSEAKYIGAYNEHYQAAGQVVFCDVYPQIELNQSATNCVEIVYGSQYNSISINMLAGVFDTENLSYPEGVTEMWEKIAENPLETVASDDGVDELNLWSYADMIEEFDVSYVVCRDQSVYSKYAKDPTFQLIFNCKNVAVFQVTK
jgi:hypothetical protein